MNHCHQVGGVCVKLYWGSDISVFQWHSEHATAAATVHPTRGSWEDWNALDTYMICGSNPLAHSKHKTHAHSGNAYLTRIHPLRQLLQFCATPFNFSLLLSRHMSLGVEKLNRAVVSYLQMF